VTWKEADARMAADDVLGRLGLDVPFLPLLRFGENALYAYPERGLVVRVARPGTPPAAIARTLEFVRRIAAEGMPVSEPTDVPGVDQPVVTSTGVVTLWRYHDVDAGCRVRPEELGAIIRRFHRIAASHADLVDPWEPFALIRNRLAVARCDQLPAELLEPLENLLAALEVSAPHLTTTLGKGVIHADAHYGNILCLPGHILLLIDFDQVCYGPHEWDLVPNLVTRRRFGMSESDFRAFSTAYGYDLRDSADAGMFIALRELGMVSWLLQQYGTSAAIDAQLRLRVATIAENSTNPVQWSAH
jgi:Ser/Thr protein kinase RdoA (MazF antagonist)